MAAADQGDLGLPDKERGKRLGGVLAAAIYQKLATGVQAAGLIFTDQERYRAPGAGLAQGSPEVGTQLEPHRPIVVQAGGNPNGLQRHGKVSSDELAMLSGNLPVFPGPARPVPSGGWPRPVIPGLLRERDPGALDHGQ